MEAGSGFRETGRVGDVFVSKEVFSPALEIGVKRHLTGY